MRAVRGRAERQHLHGVALLVGDLSNHSQPDRLDRAIKSLEATVDAQPENPIYRSDLAAAYWQRGVLADGGLEDRIAALEQAEAAVELAPNTPEAAFVVAVALDSLYLWHQALEAYEQFLQLDTASDWARWARLRIDRLTADDAFDAAEEARAQLHAAARAADSARLAELVLRDPQLAREYGELDLLPRWAGTEEAREAAELLQVANRLGEALAAINGDRLLLDAAQAADDGDARAGLAAWGAAQPFLARREYELARPLLVEACEHLEAAANPMALWARLHLAIYEYQRDAYASAYSSVASLLEAPNSRDYPSLLAHARRIQGFLQQIWGRAEAARFLGAEAVEMSARLGEFEAASNHGVALVGVLSRLDEENEVDRLLLGALEQRPTSTRLDHLYVAYWAVSARLGRQDRIELAERFQREAVTVAERSADAVLLAEAYRQLAEILEQRGRLDEAIARLEQSSAQIQAIESESVRVYLEIMNRLGKGRLMAAADAEGALHELGAAVEYLRATGFEHLLPRVLVERARHYRKLARSREAEADLLEAARLIEGHRGGIEIPHYRISIYAEAQAIYRELAIAVHAENPALAFSYADRARARVLEDWLRDGAQTAVPGTAALESPEGLVGRVAQALPERTVFVEYLLAPERALAWTVSRDEPLRQISLPLTGSEVERLIDRLGEAWDEGPAGGLGVLKALHGVLIAPLDLGPGIDTLIFVPQGGLERLPFSALREAASGDFLIETYAVVLAPSGEFVATHSKAARPVRPAARVLAVGDPEFDRDLYPDLAPLPGSRREAVAVYEVYQQYGGGGELLVGAQATADAIATKAASYDVVHLAAHGLPAGTRPLLSQIVLAEAGLGGRQGLDGLEALSLDLDPVQLVVLSSCDSSQTSVEGVMGLVLPLLAAGSDAVLASLLPVLDGESAVLMTRMHSELLAGDSPAVALQRAKIMAIEQELSPRIWAPFEVFSGSADHSLGNQGGSDG